MIALATDDRRLAAQLAFAIVLLRANLAGTRETLHPLLAELEHDASRIARTRPTLAQIRAQAQPGAYRRFDDREWLSTCEVAHIVGRTEKTVRRWCGARVFPGARKDAGTWLIPREAVSNHDNNGGLGR